MMYATSATGGRVKKRARSEAVSTPVHDFDRLFRQDGPGIWRTIYAFAGGRRDVAEEAVAEAFARAIAHSGTIRDPLAWIYRTAFRVAAAELKRERRPAPSSDPASAEVGDTGELMAALRKLSPMQRAAIVLRYEADLPVDEVAKRMGVASPTARVHLHRGRNRLRELLGSQEIDDD
jgi:RNA polymerase sigma-70 factor, ECF subfamily